MRRAAGEVELHLAFRALPGKAFDVKSVLRDNKGYYEAPGGISIELLQSTNDPDSFIEVVHYADDLTHQTDQVRVESDPEFLSRLARWHAVLAGTPEVKLYRVVDLSK